MINLEGPQEISNCPDIQPKRLNHFYIRNVKPKTESIETKRKFVKNDDYIMSTPYENSQEKWFYNKNDNGSSSLSLAIDGTYENFT